MSEETQAVRSPMIVVAEDEPLIRLVVIDTLTQAGFHVIETAHADHALSALTEHGRKIAVLFTDIHMPGAAMNGLELAHHARRQWPVLGILITSGDAEPEQHALPRNSRFVAKPHRFDEVLRHIRDLVPA